MAEGKIFVGRKAELERFKEVLKNPKGQAVLVVELCEIIVGGKRSDMGY